MNARPLPWFRAYTDMVDDEKLRLLAFEDRWHFVALLCCKGAGLLDAGDSDSLLRRKLAVKLGLAARELEEVARRLAEVGLIDFDTLQPLAWEERQFKSDSSTDRVRAYRERVKQSGNVSVTAQETDTDTDTEQQPKKKRASPSGSRLPPVWVLPDGWRTWAQTERPDVDIDREAASFADYWHAAAGAKARKADWQATWRNWIRNARPNQGRTPHATDRKLSAVERVEANIERNRRERGDPIAGAARLIAG